MSEKPLPRFQLFLLLAQVSCLGVHIAFNLKPGMEPVLWWGIAIIIGLYALAFLLGRPLEKLSARLAPAKFTRGSQAGRTPSGPDALVGEIPLSPDATFCWWMGRIFGMPGHAVRTIRLPAGMTLQHRRIALPSGGADRAFSRTDGPFVGIDGPRICTDGPSVGIDRARIGTDGPFVGIDGARIGTDGPSVGMTFP